MMAYSWHKGWHATAAGNLSRGSSKPSPTITDLERSNRMDAEASEYSSFPPSPQAALSSARREYEEQGQTLA